MQNKRTKTLHLVDAKYLPWGLVVAECWTRTFQSPAQLIDMIQPFAMFAEGIGWLEKSIRDFGRTMAQKM